jgi:hypothetical protein
VPSGGEGSEEDVEREGGVKRGGVERERERERGRGCVCVQCLLKIKSSQLSPLLLVVLSGWGG